MKTSLPFCTIDVPEGWEDRSTFQYVSPPDPSLAAPLARTQASPTGRASVVIARAGRNLGPAKAAAAKFIEDMRAAVPSFNLADSTTWNHPIYGEVPVVHFTVETGLGVAVEQAQAFVTRTATTTDALLTFSCVANRFKDHEARFRAMFEALELTK